MTPYHYAYIWLTTMSKFDQALFCLILFRYLMPSISCRYNRISNLWVAQSECLRSVMLGIHSYEGCEQECLNNNSCAAFTFEANEPLDYCLIFMQLSQLVECHDCTTSTITRILTGKYYTVTYIFYLYLNYIINFIFLIYIMKCHKVCFISLGHRL